MAMFLFITLLQMVKFATNWNIITITIKTKTISCTYMTESSMIAMKTIQIINKKGCPLI